MSDSGYFDSTVDISVLFDVEDCVENLETDSARNLESDSDSGREKMGDGDKVHIPLLHKCASYADYKTQLDGWELLTKTPKESRGMTVAMSLPYADDDKGNKYRNIREKVFERITGADLMKEDGLKKLTEFLDNELGKGEVEDEV